MTGTSAWGKKFERIAALTRPIESAIDCRLPVLIVYCLQRAHICRTLPLLHLPCVPGQSGRSPCSRLTVKFLIRKIARIWSLKHFINQIMQLLFRTFRQVGMLILRHQSDENRSDWLGA